MPHDGGIISQSVASLNVLVHDVIILWQVLFLFYNCCNLHFNFQVTFQIWTLGNILVLLDDSDQSEKDVTSNEIFTVYPFWHKFYLFPVKKIFYPAFLMTLVADRQKLLWRLKLLCAFQGIFLLTKWDLFF